jgi:sigma-B regulation protein RsbU (phosphoserine phosphatase)
MSDVKTNVVFPAEMPEIENIYGFIERALSRNEVGAETKSLQNLFKMAADEIFSNIASYGFDGSREGAAVEISIEIAKDTVSMMFRDNGKPFDPTSRKTPDISRGLDERPVGGLGIHIVKNSFDEVHYSFENGFNVLTLKKWLKVCEVS